MYKLMYLVVDGGMVQQVNHSLLLSFLLPLAPPDSLLDVEIRVSHCLRFVLSEVCQISVSEKCPKMKFDCSKLFWKASHTWSTFLRSWTVSSRVSQRLYALSPPATSMRAPLPLLRYLVCHEDHIHSPLEEFPCDHLVSCSPVHLQILLPWDRRHDFCN